MYLVAKLTQVEPVIGKWYCSGCQNEMLACHFTDLSSNKGICSFTMKRNSKIVQLWHWNVTYYLEVVARFIKLQLQSTIYMYNCAFYISSTLMLYYRWISPLRIILKSLPRRRIRKCNIYCISSCIAFITKWQFIW